MDHIGICLPTLVIFISFGLPRLCGAQGEFAVNIAYGKPATQSSTYIGRIDFGDTPGYPYEASLAVDGNKNTSFKDDGCSHTDFVGNIAWWEVDLLGLYKVSNITIYQRTDGSTDWLRGFVTRGKLSNNSFVNIDNPKSYMTGTVTIPVHTSLKFNKIRIELDKMYAAICLCEVEVLAEINVAENKPATQSSVYSESSPFMASLAVDGNTNTIFSENSCSHTNTYQSSAWWNVDLQALYLIIGIRIYQRSDAAENRLQGFTLFGLHANGSYEPIQTPQPYHTGEIDIPISPPRMFRAIMVQLNHSSEEVGPIIALCEVQAFAGTMCSKPPLFPRRSLHKFILGKEGNWSYNFVSLTINCIKGYIIEGSSSVMCVDIDRWNGSFGRCSEIHCTDQLVRPNHGMLHYEMGIDRRVAAYNSTVSITCDSGYSPMGKILLRCNESAQWDGPLGSCVVKQCNEPIQQVAHGVLVFKDGIEGNGTYNTTVSLNCLEGNKRNSVGQLRCADNEQWQGSLGLCLVKQCNEPIQQVAHGFLTFKDGIEGNGTYNTTVSLHCLEGYKLNSVGQSRCADNEQWQGSLGLCLVKQCNEPIQQVAHGFLTFKDGIEGNGTYNTTVSLHCLEGYKLNSVGQSRCADNEQWQGSLGLCLTISCHIPDIDPTKGTYEFHPGFEGNSSYTSYLTIQCKEGYRLIGADSIRCTNTGKWDTSIGQCTVIQCSEPLILPNNSVSIYEAGIEGNLTYNSTMSITCQEGYKLSGRHLIRCNELGAWDSTFGSCLVVDCGWPKDVPHHVSLLIMPGISGGSSYNATACIQSKEGLKHDGNVNETFRCSSEGSWRGSLEKCFENIKKEAYIAEAGKQIVLPIAILVPICLILIATNIVTLVQHRRCACYRRQPSENIQGVITIADHFGSSSFGITEREQTTLSHHTKDIELKRTKSGSEEIQSHDTGPYDELQKDTRKGSAYDKLEFKRDFTPEKGAIYEATDGFPQI